MCVCVCVCVRLPDTNEILSCGRAACSIQRCSACGFGAGEGRGSCCRLCVGPSPGWQGWLASRNSWNSWWLLGWDWSSACITSLGQLLILGTTPLRSYVQFHLWDLANFTLTIIHPHGPQGKPCASLGVEKEGTSLLTKNLNVVVKP